MKTMEQVFASNKIVPVVVINDVAAAIPLAETLLSAGINNMEITLRTANALEIIAKIAKELPEMVVGAGTILTRENFLQAYEAGSQYIISPGVTEELFTIGKEFADKVRFIPGICTPSQAMDALNNGINHVKFFPAEPYNAYNVIKALASPLPQLKFCPTGGVTIDNMQKYLELPNIFAVGLSSIVEAKLTAAHDFAEIKRRCDEAVSIVKTTINK
ncbi:MAG: bifunctional 4-hydroxy-2-oxoglutarate aldolase/2-dehydro-3-deoxy-phosphogluconate aldolase [Burkholderiales bacterium]|jgi:2-dehydro-3-deoxyphosphogluconate aldolase/(4S)-4-hydroxy-2-oxoglutarate aldolase|nr:bifunctional 4-hydroxy-2-oxoglutarate aldolase/2-dehydro-3-deoxy-phosphogluconate aldolase [Burkholderiales bacterium]